MAFLDTEKRIAVSTLTRCYRDIHGIIDECAFSVKVWPNMEFDEEKSAAEGEMYAVNRTWGTYQGNWRVYKRIDYVL